MARVQCTAHRGGGAGPGHGDDAAGGKRSGSSIDRSLVRVTLTSTTWVYAVHQMDESGAHGPKYALLRAADYWAVDIAQAAHVPTKEGMRANILAALKAVGGLDLQGDIWRDGCLLDWHM